MIFCVFSFAGEEIFADFEVYAKQSSKLAFESSGKVDKIFVDVSSHVKKGDTLASLDQTSLEIALKKAKNDLALAKNAKEFAKSSFSSLVASSLNLNMSPIFTKFTYFSSIAIKILTSSEFKIKAG